MAAAAILGSEEEEEKRRRPKREIQNCLFFSDFILRQVRLYVFIRNKLFRPCRGRRAANPLTHSNPVASMLLARNPFRFECHVLH